MSCLHQQQKGERLLVESLSDLKVIMLDRIEKELMKELSLIDTPKLHFKPEQTRAIYIFGSQVYFCKRVEPIANDNHVFTTESTGSLIFKTHQDTKRGKEANFLQFLKGSDFDVMLVCDDLSSENYLEGGCTSSHQFKWVLMVPIQTMDGSNLDLELEISFLSTRYFLSFVNYHQPVMLQFITHNTQDDSFVIYEDETFAYWRRNWSKWLLKVPRLKNSFIHGLHFCMNKAYRFWVSFTVGEMVGDEGVLKKVKKNICHGYRLLRVSFGCL